MRFYVLFDSCFAFIIMNFWRLYNSDDGCIIRVTANLITDEGYWERCCKARWQVCDVSNYAKSWKRMYFEKNLEGQEQMFLDSFLKLVNAIERGLGHNAVVINKDYLKENLNTPVSFHVLFKQKSSRSLFQEPQNQIQ